MPMPMRGLEMVCICRNKHFAIQYEGGQYRLPPGLKVSDLLDMTCFSCGAAYYTHLDDAIEFCPNCGRFERRRFESAHDLAVWARDQSWKFLKLTGNQVFAVCREERDWFLAFAPDAMALEIQGVYLDVQPIQAGSTP